MNLLLYLYMLKGKDCPFFSFLLFLPFCEKKRTVPFLLDFTGGVFVFINDQ